MTAFEVVQILLAFGQFAISLIGLCYKIFKNDDKNK
ncbi:putative holin-like toxin [Streptococcus hyointestinalis]|nr:putative holin-like toxin [Streptococcus hyointestinalis]MDD7357180.1 putative holin-like toxin [Streptococcus hyointestinalis]